MLAADRRSFHKCVKSFVTDEKAKQWTPRQMFPSLAPQEVAERCVDFFNGISAEYEPLKTSKIPRTFDGDLIHVTPKIVANEIKKGKKPKSRVDGDLFVTSLVENLEILAPVIAKIYNKNSHSM